VKFKNETDVAHPEITNGIPKVEINTDDTAEKVSIPVTVKTDNGIKIGFQV
jgi:hypothetical protein